MTEAITSDTYNGNPSVRFTRTFVFQLPQGPSTQVAYSEFDPTGKLLAETVNGSLEAVTSNTFDVPSTLTPTTSVTGTITFADGSTFQETYKVVGYQTVSTPAGTFDCWEVNQTDENSNGNMDTYKLWVAPQTGNYVILDDKTVGPNDNDYTYNVTLTGLTTPSAAQAVPHIGAWIPPRLTAVR
jgi:hypothetical protein